MLRIDEKDDEQRLLTHTNTHRELHPMERVLNEAGAQHTKSSSAAAASTLPTVSRSGQASRGAFY